MAEAEATRRIAAPAGMDGSGTARRLFGDCRHIAVAGIGIHAPRSSSRSEAIAS